MDQQRRQSGNEGSILLGMIILLLIMAGISLVSLRNAMGLMRISSHQYRWEQALFSAEAGIEQAAAIISQHPYYQGTEGESLQLRDSASTFSIHPLDVEGKTFEVESSGTFKGKARRLKVNRFFFPAYTDYALYMTDYRNAFFSPGQVTDGNVFLGSQLKVSAYKDFSTGEVMAPTFRGKVESAEKEIYNLQHQRRGKPDRDGKIDQDYVDFQKGPPSLGVEHPPITEVSFEEVKRAADFHDGKTGALPSWYEIPPGTREGYHGSAITFSGPTEVDVYMKKVLVDGQSRREGFIAFKNKDKFGDNEWHERPQEGLELVYIADDQFSGAPGTLTMAEHTNDYEINRRKEKRWPGYVSDDFSFYAEDDIHIQSHLRYWDDVEIDPDSNDKVLFVSGDDIWIDTRWRAAEDWDGITIEAALFASGKFDEDNGENSKGRIGVMEWKSKSAMGEMDVLGSYLGQHYGYSGTFNRSGLVSGFMPNRRMDTRFVTDPPPFTPVLRADVNYLGWHEP